MNDFGNCVGLKPKAKGDWGHILIIAPKNCNLKSKVDFVFKIKTSGYNFQFK